MKKLLRSQRWLLVILLSSYFSISALAQTTWTGTTNTDWATPGNWTAGVPEVDDDVTIPNTANKPVGAGTATVAKSAKITVAAAQLTISSTASLSINGSTGFALENFGTSDNSGTIRIGNTSSVANRDEVNQSGRTEKATLTISNPSSGSPTTQDIVITDNDIDCTTPSNPGFSINFNPCGNIISLTASEVGVTYQLKRDNVDDGLALAGAGTGSTISFPKKTAGGTYTLLATRTSGGCTALFSVITTSAASIPDASARSNSPICAGQALNLSASGGSAYLWAFGSNIQNPTITATTAMSGTYTYTVTVTNDQGCTAAATTSVQVNANPTATASSNSPICAGQTLNLSASGGGTYAWAASGFTSTDQDPFRSSATTAMSGTYSVTVTNNGCTATATTSVQVNAAPNATASSNAPICAGQTLDLSASGGGTYAWEAADGFTSDNQTPTRNTATTAMSGTYTVTVTNDRLCTATAMTTVQVNANPIAGINPSATSICAGSTIDLAGTGGDNYSWAASEGNFNSSTGSPTSWRTTSSSGTYSISVTVANGFSCTASTIASVTVIPQPTASINPSTTQSICAGVPLNLMASGGGPYSWSGPSFNSTNAIASLNTSSTSYSGVYQVLVGTGICTATATVSVSIKPNPVPAPSSNSPICTGQTLQLSTTAVGTYSWEATSYSSTQQNPSRSPATTAMSGVYKLTVSSNSCTATATISVQVVTQPTAQIAPSGTQNICQGQALNLTASGGSPYSWSGPSFNSTNAIASINTTSTSNSGIYNVLVGSGVCTATATVSVQINPSITVSVSFAPVCLVGNALNLSASGGDEYRWRGPNSFTSTSATPTKAKTVAKDEGIYSVTVTGNGVCTATSTIRVFYGIGAGGISITNRSPYCKGGPISLTATAAGGSTYRWTKQFGTVNFIGNPVTISNNAKSSDGGVYMVFVTGQNGCIEKQETLVTVSPVPCVGTRLASEEIEDIDMQINAYPNPVTNTLTVEVTLKEPSKLRLSLFNSIGKESGTWQLNEEATVHKTELNMSQLTGGVYLLQAQAGKQKVVKRVVKIQY